MCSLGASGAVFPIVADVETGLKIYRFPPEHDKFQMSFGAGDAAHSQK